MGGVTLKEGVHSMTTASKLAAVAIALGFAVAGCSNSGTFPGPSDDQVMNPYGDGPLPLGLSAPSEDMAEEG